MVNSELVEIFANLIQTLTSEVADLIQKNPGPGVELPVEDAWGRTPHKMVDLGWPNHPVIKKNRNLSWS